MAAEIDRDERKGEKPSDHFPVAAQFTELDADGQNLVASGTGYIGCRCLSNMVLVWTDLLRRNRAGKHDRL